MRYYYDCVFKAAYMAKYFDMKFQDFESSDEGKVHTVNLELMLEGGDFDKPMAKYYVHPDSLSLLEPHVGDIAQYWITTIPDYFSQSTAKKTKEHIKRITKHLMFYIKHQVGMSNFKIIQRNGNPFFWPESEDAIAVMGTATSSEVRPSEDGDAAIPPVPANGTLIDYLAARGLVFILGIPPKSEDGTLLIWEGGCNARVAHWEGNKLIQWDDSEPIEINDVHSWMRLPHPSIWPFVDAPTELLPEADLYSAKTDVLTAFGRQSS